MKLHIIASDVAKNPDTNEFNNRFGLWATNMIAEEVFDIERTTNLEEFILKVQTQRPKLNKKYIYYEYL